MTLKDGNCQATYTVQAVHLAGRLRRRMAVLGLLPGTPVQVLHKKRGAMVIRLRGSRFAVGDSITEKINVEVCGEKELAYSGVCRQPKLRENHAV